MKDKFGNVEKRKAGDVISKTEAKLINDILFLYNWSTLHTINKTDAFDKLIETAIKIKEEREVVK